MKKYYVIKLAFDHGFWSEEKQDFVGWLNASKWETHFVIVDNMASYDCPFQYALEAARNKNPCCVIEVFDN